MNPPHGRLGDGDGLAGPEYWRDGDDGAAGAEGCTGLGRAGAE
jgi:hypothetical protein